VIEQPRGEHSAKPEAGLELIESYFPNLPKIKLNRRGPARPRCSAWGNEVAETI
jgi:N6-adenosine-specific RNA methylase IME4